MDNLISGMESQIVFNSSITLQLNGHSLRMNRSTSMLDGASDLLFMGRRWTLSPHESVTHMTGNI